MIEMMNREANRLKNREKHGDLKNIYGTRFCWTRSCQKKTKFIGENQGRVTKIKEKT